MTTATKTTWKMKGDAIGACSCDWGCPCNFEAAPTKGWCEGGYSFHINEGNHDDVRLDGLNFAFFGHSPAALHLGNMTAYLVIDERANEAQRAALVAIASGQLGGIFGVLGGLITKVVGPEFVPADFHFDGANSHAIFGDRVEIRLGEIRNPVTGEPSAFSLSFSNGLLTDKAELMTTSTMRINHPDLSYDHTGQYGETFHFNYEGEG